MIGAIGIHMMNPVGVRYVDACSNDLLAIMMDAASICVGTDVRKRLRSIWYQANQLGNEDQMDKAAKYRNWVALPLRTVTVDGPPFSVPRYLHLDLGRQTQRSVAHFRLHSHALRVETKSWELHDGTCDKCGLQAIQDEKHALFLCRCMQMCSLRLQFADLFHDLPMAHKINVNQTGAFYFSQACSEDVFIFSRNKLMIPIVFRDGRLRLTVSGLSYVTSP